MLSHLYFQIKSITCYHEIIMNEGSASDMSWNNIVFLINLKKHCAIYSGPMLI